MKLPLTLILILALTALPGTPQQAVKPLSKDQVMDLVKAGMDSQELAKKVEQLGIDFEPTDDYLQALRQAGAQEALIKALRAAHPKPLTQKQVLELVAGGVPSQRAADLVKQRGIDFVPDEKYLETLRVAGAEDVVLTALREAGEAVTGQLEIETTPNAEVYLDGQLAGRAGADGRLALKSKPGTHALRVSLTGKRDFTQQVTLVTGQTAEVKAPLAVVAGSVKENPKDALKYVWIPPGIFQMGCSPGDSDCRDEEKPAHQVTIRKGFWIGQTEVTVGAYKRFSGEAGHAMPPAPGFNSGWSNGQMPVVNVTWDDAQAYCGWAGGRLPTEAEWEYAARGGSTEPRYGDIDGIAWYSGNSGPRTHDVGQKRANGFGLFDVLGNVWEWVSDWHDAYENSPAVDPPGPSSGQERVLRGGSLTSGPRGVRVSNRYWLDPGLRLGNGGFRCVGEVGSP